jgi:hypothetical protein
VACPYFYPTERLEQPLWPHPRRLPLGGGYAGSCTAAPGEEFRPGEKALEWCNLGYARGTCPRFPEGPGPDAVRFIVAHDDGKRIRIQFAIERDHRPGGSGWLEYERESEGFGEPPGDRTLARQAEAYVASYLRYRHG